LLFNLLGFWGICFLFCAIRDVAKHNKSVNTFLSFIIFLPGLNYWTSMIGKDAMIIMAIGMLIYSLVNVTRRKIIFVLSLVLIGHIRPYMGIIILPCLAFSFLTVSGQLKVHQKAMFLIFFGLVSIPLYHAFLEHVRINELNLTSASEILEAQQKHWGGGSYVDITHANIVVKVVTYLFRPLFFDAKNIVQVTASLENLMYIVLTFILCTPRVISFLINGKLLLLRFSITYFLIGTAILSSSTPNLGTAVRQKNMVMMALLTIISLYVDYLTAHKRKKNSGQVHLASALSHPSINKLPKVN
jgi:hypothetical protein